MGIGAGRVSPIFGFGGCTRFTGGDVGPAWVVASSCGAPLTGLTEALDEDLGESGREASGSPAEGFSGGASESPRWDA